MIELLDRFSGSKHSLGSIPIGWASTCCLNFIFSSQQDSRSSMFSSLSEH